MTTEADEQRGAAPRLLERVFGLSEHGTTPRTEVLAGATTFLTMAYILFVNPQILGDAGMPKEAVFGATCLASALATLIMGLYANYPIGLAPGMGLNAYFAYVVVGQLHFSWQAALGAVFISGCCFLLTTLLKVRQWIIDGIPASLRIAITVGIGLFLAIIALQNAGLVVANKATLVGLGDLRKAGPLLAVFGFLLICVLAAHRVRGALVIGILTVTVLSFAVGGNAFHGVFAWPPSLAPTLLALDVKGALTHGLVDVVLVLFLVEVFDATGTLLAVAGHAGLFGWGRDHRLGRALLADSSGIVAGAMLGTSSTTAYLESASGVQAGGRTGLTAVTVALLFLVSLFFAPLAGAVPAYATAPALFYVACLMLRDFANLEWDDLTEVAPAAVTALTMPFTYSIANGIAFGFITYAALKLATGSGYQVKPALWIVVALFLVRFAVAPAG